MFEKTGGNVLYYIRNTKENLIGFRYRSYYYDVEIKLYYLNTRYYNPKWGRFISADGLINLESDEVSYNLYNYSNNNSAGMMNLNGEILF